MDIFWNCTITNFKGSIDVCLSKSSQIYHLTCQVRDPDLFHVNVWLGTPLLSGILLQAIMSHGEQILWFTPEMLIQEHTSTQGYKPRDPANLSAKILLSLSSMEWMGVLHNYFLVHCRVVPSSHSTHILVQQKLSLTTSHSETFFYATLRNRAHWNTSPDKSGVPWCFASITKRAAGSGIFCLAAWILKSARLFVCTRRRSLRKETVAAPFERNVLKF